MTALQSSATIRTPLSTRLSNPSKSCMSGPRPEQSWFKKAEQDLEMAQPAMLPGNPIPPKTCYHAQQCAEKYLKGFLVSTSHSFNFVHDLFYLTQECAQRQPAFSDLELAAETLGRYGAGVRYPLENFVDPDEEEACEAIKLAEEVATFVKSQL